MVWRFGLVTMTTHGQRHNYPINHTANLHIIFGTANARLVFLCSVYYFYRELKYGTYGLPERSVDHCGDAAPSLI